MSCPPNDSRPADPALRARIEDAARGLLYASESDRPIDFVSVPRPAGALTPASFAAAAGAEGQPAEEQTLDAFFARHIERAPEGDPAIQTLKSKYVALKSELQRSLGEVRVFRIGEIEIRCFAVGDDGAGHLVGIETVSVET